MKNLLMRLFSVLLVSFLMLSNVSALAAEKHIEMRIKNMESLTDQYKVRKILSSLDGMISVVLYADDDHVEITYDDEKNSLFEIKTALASIGYPATKVKKH